MISAIAIATLVLLALMGLVIHMLSRQTYSELLRIDGFLRAVAVAEACHARLLARLEGAPWEQRWFKGSSDAGSDDWKDGTYDFLIADGPKPFEADLLVRAVALRSRVVLFWRLRADPFTLSPYRHVQTLFFTHAESETPVTLPGLDRLRREVDDAIGVREGNRGWAEDTERRFEPVAQVGQIASILGVPAAPPIPDSIPPVTPGQPSSPQAPRSGPEAAPSLPALPAFPLPGAVPNPPATPPGLQQLAGTRARVRNRRVAFRTRMDELNAKLGEAPFNPSNPIASSVFTRMQYDVAKKLADCSKGALGGGQDCTPEEVAKLQSCNTAVGYVDNTIRPKVNALQQRAWDALKESDTLERDMDAAAEPPGPTSAQADGLERRAGGVDDEEADIVSKAADLEAQMDNAFKAASCYDLK
ncbi:MAG: hypothetical protein HY303_01160 [Candidatus Wallbacteria bacterium]|nr:hypothetical protein [Candidatus Wallbacteria bacterium]